MLMYASAFSSVAALVAGIWQHHSIFMLVVLVWLATSAMLSVLTMEIREDTIRWSFGAGLFSKTVPFRQIAFTRCAPYTGAPLAFGYNRNVDDRTWRVKGNATLVIGVDGVRLQYILVIANPQTVRSEIERRRAQIATAT